MADDTFDGFDGGDGVEFNDDDIEFIDDDHDDDEYGPADDDFEPLGFEDVAEAIGLPDELPAIRVSPDTELAAQARAAALPRKLAALADWVGEDGRTTSDEGDLTEADTADAARAVGAPTGELLFLWEYALTGDWADFEDEDDDEDDEAADDDAATAHVVRAETADAWATGTDSSVLDAWRATMVSVLTSTFDVILDNAPDPVAEMDFDGQGIAMAIMLFLARGEGLAMTDISEVILETATSEMEPDDGAQAREVWLGDFGDPARLITSMLAQLGAVTLPDSDDGTVRLTPLGLWAVRGELADVGITIPVLPASVADMTAAELLLVADDADEAEFESESDAWVAARGAEQAARELLLVAAADGPDSRLLAVSVVTRIGSAAEPAWRDSLDTPALRPYAKIALAGPGESPETAVPADLEPLAEDLAWVATDMLALACDDEEPDPEVIAEALGDSVPAGEEARLFEMMALGSHPDTVDVLRHIGQHHPDKRIAKDARTAAHRARSRQGGEL